MARSKKKPVQVCAKPDFGYTEKPEVLTSPLPALDAVFTCSGIDEDVLGTPTTDYCAPYYTSEAEREGAELGDYNGDLDDIQINVEMTYEGAINYVCEDMRKLLIKKNLSYGGAAFKDVVLAGTHVSAEKAILVRMSDKVRRLQEGTEFEADDQIQDLAGYCLLLQAVRLYKTERGG